MVNFLYCLNIQTGKSKRKTDETDNSNSVQPTVEKKRQKVKLRKTSEKVT